MLKTFALVTLFVAAPAMAQQPVHASYSRTQDAPAARQQRQRAIAEAMGRVKLDALIDTIVARDEAGAPNVRREARSARAS